MHNLVPYTDNAFSLYKDAVERKDAGESKDRLLAAEATIQAYYEEFDQHFSNNTLRDIAPRRARKPLKDDLFEMYSFVKSNFFFNNFKKFSFQQISAFCIQHKVGHFCYSL